MRGDTVYGSCVTIFSIFGEIQKQALFPDLLQVLPRLGAKQAKDGRKGTAPFHLISYNMDRLLSGLKRRYLFMHRLDRHR